MRTQHLFSSLLLILFCGIVKAQETGIINCTDGIDNDNDGLIDLNDDDCICNDLMANSLIPNPSFEDMSCCPTNEADLDCADDWIQASAATTDYVHTCGVLGNPFLGFEAPLPFPDGEGAIGFRDGKPGSPNFKEYTGACLTAPMTQGVEYRLDFFVGFHEDPGSLTFDMAVFATTDCNNLPFGNGDPDIGCPTNSPNWVEVGEMQVSGENEWKNVVFDFMADEAYSAIVLGPACEVNANFMMDPYFYFDRLVLAERSMFTVPLNVNGDICDDNLVLSVDEVDEASYQWFINGVAIPNATTNQLPIPNTPASEATFEAIIITETGCNNSESFTVEIPVYQSDVSETICEGETYNLFGFVLDSTDVYTLTTTASDGCDSMVVLDLMVLDEIIENVTFDICTGEEIVINSRPYTVGGTYIQDFTSVDGCDSTLVINLVELPNSVSELNFEVCNGQSITVNGEEFTTVGSFQQNLRSANGCDSLINITISELPSSVTNLNFEFCQGDSLRLNNEVFNMAGTFQQTLPTLSGCDSIINIAISLIPGVVNRKYYTICGSNPITVNGVEYTEAGEYVENFVDLNGCEGSNILVVENDPNCEDCGSDPFFISSIAVQKLSQDLYEVQILQDDETVLKDIFDEESTLTTMVQYIVIRKKVSDFSLDINDFKSNLLTSKSSLQSVNYVSKDWFNRNGIEVSKEFRFDVNGEYQMLKKQFDNLKIGNRMSHI